MDAFVNLTGWIGTQVELRTTRAGVPCCTFRVGVTPRLRRAGDWTDGETTWMTVTCFRSLAENVAASVGRGDPVIVAGKLRTHVWTDGDGVENERMVLEATAVGPDLGRGTSTFHKTVREYSTSDDPFEIGEQLLAVERQAAAETDLDAHEALAPA